MSLGRYVGTLCNRCESGRFLMMGTCTIKCEDIEPHAAFGVVTVFGITACVICWLVMNRMTAGRFDAMDVGLLYCQIIDIVFNFSTNQRVSRDSWYVTTRIFSLSITTSISSRHLACSGVGGAHPTVAHVVCSHEGLQCRQRITQVAMHAGTSRRSL